MPQPYEWTVLRVVPRVERGEYVNVGVIVNCQQLDHLTADVTADLDRARGLDAGIDTDAVRWHLDGVRALCAGHPSVGANAQRPPGERFRWLDAPRTTVVQAGPVHTGLTDDPAAELADLFRRMVTPL